MTLSPEQRAPFEAAARPLIQWLNENCHPHVTVIVDTTTAQLSKGVAYFVTSEYVKD